MRTAVYGIVLLVVAGGLSPAALLRTQAGACLVPSGPAEDVVRATIGYFAEAEPEVAEFCRLLETARIAGTLVPLGSLNDRATAGRVQAALETGEIDVLWLNTAALGQLISGSSIAAKVLAVTDFLVVHVVVRDPRIEKVTDPAFREVEVRVPPGRAGFFADALFAALGLPIRCLDLASRCAEARSDGEYKVFLDEPHPRAVVLAAPTLHRGTRDMVALILAQISPDFRLVAVPPDVIVRMRRMPGMVSTIAIPRGYYALGARRDVPPADIGSAAAAMLLVGGTPASVAVRVQAFTTRVNQVLLADAPRLPPSIAVQSLQMVREMGEHAPGRIALHPEYAKKLRDQGMFLPGLPVAEALPGSGPSPIPLPAPAVRIREFIAAPSVITPGSRARLCWIIESARDARIDPEVGPVPAMEVEKGCRTVAPQRTTIYTLTATGHDGRSVRRQLAVEVRITAGTAVIREFTAIPAVIRQGATARLCWSVANARSVHIDPEVGLLGLEDREKGCRSVSPQRTITYTLTATGDDGRAVQARATVTVQPTALPAPRPLRPGSPDPKAPTNLFPCRQVELQWTAVIGAGAVDYTVGLDRQDPATGRWENLLTRSTRELRLDVSRFTSQGNVYRWNVRARDASGNAGPVSPSLYFACPIG